MSAGPAPDAEVIPRTSEIQGLVDNVQAGRLFGWAWNPALPGERLTIELRLGKDVVATTIAETERADLAAAGIGDGRHAFDLPLTPELVARRAELFIVARSSDGVESPLPLLGARRTVAAVPGGASANGSVRALSETQQALRDRIEALTMRGAADTAALEELQQRVETLEGWCMRLDERMAALAAAGQGTPPRKRLDAWQIVLGTAAVTSMVVGLAATLIGGARLAGGG